MSDDPLARRDWHADRHAAGLRARGLDVSSEAIQRVAAEDLRLLDAVTRSGALRKRTGAKRKPDLAASTARAQAAAEKVGGRAYVKALPANDPAPRRQAAPTGTDALRLAAMTARIARICTKVQRVKVGQEMGAGFEFPELVTALLVATHNFEAARGEYAGKRRADRDRIYRRQLEDICDKSNAVIRPAWWVK